MASQVFLLEYVKPFMQNKYSNFRFFPIFLSVVSIALWTTSSAPSERQISTLRQVLPSASMEELNAESSCCSTVPTKPWVPKHPSTSSFASSRMTVSDRVIYPSRHMDQLDLWGYQCAADTYQNWKAIKDCIHDEVNVYLSRALPSLRHSRRCMSSVIECLEVKLHNFLQCSSTTSCAPATVGTWCSEYASPMEPKCLNPARVFSQTVSKASLLLPLSMSSREAIKWLPVRFLRSLLFNRQRRGKWTQFECQETYFCRQSSLWIQSIFLNIRGYF